MLLFHCMFHSFPLGLFYYLFIYLCCRKISQTKHIINPEITTLMFVSLYQHLNITVCQSVIKQGAVDYKKLNLE